MLPGSLGSWKKTVKVYAWRTKSRAGFCKCQTHTHTHTMITSLYAHPTKNKNHDHIYKNFTYCNFTSQIPTPFPYMLSLFVCQQNSSQTSKAGLWALEVARPRGKDNSKEAPAWWTKAVHGTQKELKRRFRVKGSWLKLAFLVDDDIFWWRLWWWQWCWRWSWTQHVLSGIIPMRTYPSPFQNRRQVLIITGLKTAILVWVESNHEWMTNLLNMLLYNVF